MSRRGVVNTMVAVAAILVTSGLAANAVITQHLPPEPTSLVATGTGGLDAVRPESPAATAAPIPTVPRTTTPRASRGALPPGSVTITAPHETTTSVVPPTTEPPNVAPILTLPPAPPPSTPSVVRTSPSSWRMEANGVTIDASISPAVPQVGDTVTISYTMAGDGDFCCLGFVYVDGELIGQNEMPAGSCPLPDATTGSATALVSKPGPFRFQVQATRIVQLCAAPPVFATANLHALVLVPAG